MGEAFTSATGSLAQRLMASLDAAEAGGGGLARPRRRRDSSSVAAEGEPWERMSTCAWRRATARSSSCAACSGAPRATGARIALGPGAPGAAEDGLPEGYVRFLAMLDAAGRGDTAEGKRLLAEIVAEQPMWLEAFRRFARHPEMPPLGDILDP